jgi:hypothetical protein
VGAVVSMTSAKVNDVGDIQRSRQTSYRWQKWIDWVECFARNQLHKRDWINFAEVADWYSDWAGPNISSEVAHANAYRMLQQDLLDGDFEQGGRSAVRLLHPRIMRRLQPEYLRTILQTHGAAKIRSDILPRCWFPLSSFEQWCAKHHLPASPSRFQPKQQNASPSKAPIYKTGLPGKPTSRHLFRNEFFARAERNETKKTLREEASALCGWLTHAHPTAPPAKRKTIENALRAEFRSLKSKKARK